MWRPASAQPVSWSRIWRFKHLAGPGLRELVDEHHPLGALRARQMLVGMGDDVVGRDRAGGHDDGAHRLAPLVVGHTQHGDLGDRGWASSTFSISAGYTLTPPVRIMSFLRSQM